MRRIRDVWGRGLLSLAIALATGACERSSEPTGDTSEADRAAPSEVVATVGAHKIRLTEVDKLALADNMEVFQALYEARKSALDELIEAELLAVASVSEGLTLDQLIAREVTNKVAEVTDAEVEAFYNENTPQVEGQTLEQIGPRIHLYLTSMRTAVQRRGLLAGLRQLARVRISLDPPRRKLIVAANEPSLGPTTAPVTIVEYSDFQ